MAVQMLFQSDLGGSPLPQIFNSFDPASQADGSRQGRAGGQTRAAYDYGKSLVTGTLQHREEIDRLIRQQAEHWRLERMPVVDRNILRLAVYEFLYETDVPKLVVLDEAIELAKRFGSEQSGRFVNGLLDGLLKQHEFPGRMK
jgi:N utilization substance protein B